MRATRRQFLRGLGAGIGAAAAYPVLSSIDVAGRRLLVPRASAAGLVKLDPSLPIHPLLQYGALAEPTKRVRVIVTKSKPEHAAAGIARGAGAKLEEEFAFIRSMVLEVPQQAVFALARNPHVAYIHPDGAVQHHADGEIGSPGATLKTIYPLGVNATKVWNDARLPATGAGVTVAVLDTGAAAHPDLTNLVNVRVNARALGVTDFHGHGTHVAGTVNGRSPSGHYYGIAPGARVLSIKISDDTGLARESDVLKGLRWCYDNRSTYNIRAVNLSISAGRPASYQNSPMAAACERLWFAGVTVVAASGNRGDAPDASWYGPGNDPFVISVGALDDSQTLGAGDDVLAAFSGRGKSQNGHYRPDIIAPGRRIVAPLAPSSVLARELAERITDGGYIRLSGTSMAAPVVTGVIALLLERFPSLTPDQIKWVLTATSRQYSGMADRAGVVDAYAAMQRAAQGGLGLANQGIQKNSTINGSTSKDASTQTYWDQTYWDQTYWDQTYWDAGTSLD